MKNAFLNGDLQEEVYMDPTTRVQIERKLGLQVKVISLWLETIFKRVVREVYLSYEEIGFSTITRKSYLSLQLVVNGCSLIGQWRDV